MGLDPGSMGADLILAGLEPESIGPTCQRDSQNILVHGNEPGLESMGADLMPGPMVA